MRYLRILPIALFVIGLGVAITVRTIVTSPDVLWTKHITLMGTNFVITGQIPPHAGFEVTAEVDKGFFGSIGFGDNKWIITLDAIPLGETNVIYFHLYPPPKGDSQPESSDSTNFLVKVQYKSNGVFVSLTVSDCNSLGQDCTHQVLKQVSRNTPLPEVIHGASNFPGPIGRTKSAGNSSHHSFVRPKPSYILCKYIS